MAGRDELIWRRHLHRVTAPVEERFAEAYRDQMEALQEASQDTTRPFALAEWKRRVADAMAPYFLEAFAAGARDMLGLPQMRGKKFAPGAVVKANRASAEILQSFRDQIEETVQTTYDALSDIVEQAQDEDLTDDEVEQLLEDEWDDIMGARTDTIATTEVNGAVNSVRDYLMQEVVEFQRWVTAGDERVRDTHVTYGDAGPKPVGFNWAELTSGSDYALRFPGDPECNEPGEIINCRCFVTPEGDVEVAPEDLADFLDRYGMEADDLLAPEEQDAVLTAAPAGTFKTLAYSQKNDAVLLTKGEGFDEGQHPRDEGGKFSEGGGATGEGAPSAGAGAGVGEGEQEAGAKYEAVAGSLVKGSKEEMEALRDYRQEGYKAINGSLRAGNGCRAKCQRLGALFDSAKPFAEDAIVYRGVPKVGRFGALKVGDVFRDNGFISTSFSRSVTQTFIGGTGLTMKIRIPKGHKALPGIRIEREAILRNGTRFRVASIDAGGNPSLEIVQ